MKCVLLLSIIALVAISSCVASDLIVGTSYNAHLTWQQKADYMAFPFKKRVKEVFYSDAGQQIIRGIIARDLDHSAAIATVTAGGVGFPFVNIRLKSERGAGLHYQIEIYV
ncbi:uncharacterized protein LOC142972379 [Anticarsia gemmatalis]|uniref:uncharacterized protein LOC142972379 n=1 Tax=Anticarsia gemmatalis TaxID=129554 RepID=UPI003F7669A3